MGQGSALLHQTLGRGEDGSDLIGWAGRPKVTLEVDRDARTRTSGATREKSDGPCRQRETDRLHRGGHLIPITPEGSLRVPFTSTLIDQCPSEGSRDDARCRPLSKERHSQRFDRNGLSNVILHIGGKEAWKRTAQF